jgi:hypothetical protein
MGNKSAAVVIAPEHQSAPKVRLVDPRTMLPAAPARKKAAGYLPPEPVTHYGDEEYDRELDHPLYHDRKIQAEIAALPRLDKSPSLTVEKMLEERELNYMRSAAQRWEGQQRWQGKENVEMRLVNLLTPNAFIRQLARGGISAGVENPVVSEFIRERKQYVPSDPLTEITGSGGPRIWLNDFVGGMRVRKPDGSTELISTGRVGVNAWVKPDIGTKAWERGDYVARTITSLQELGPEWTVMRFNEYNVPTNERYRGWRTVLLALVMSEVLTEEEAHRAFPLRPSAASTFYQQQLQTHRSKKY